LDTTPTKVYGDTGTEEHLQQMVFARPISN